MVDMAALGELQPVVAPLLREAAADFKSHSRHRPIYFPQDYTVALGLLEKEPIEAAVEKFSYGVIVGDDTWSVYAIVMFKDKLSRYNFSTFPVPSIIKATVVRVGFVSHPTKYGSTIPALYLDDLSLYSAMLGPVVRPVVTTIEMLDTSPNNMVGLTSQNFIFDKKNNTKPASFQPRVPAIVATRQPARARPQPLPQEQIQPRSEPKPVSNTLIKDTRTYFDPDHLKKTKDLLFGNSKSNLERPDFYASRVTHDRLFEPNGRPGLVIVDSTREENDNHTKPLEDSQVAAAPLPLGSVQPTIPQEQEGSDATSASSTAVKETQNVSNQQLSRNNTGIEAHSHSGVQKPRVSVIPPVVQPLSHRNLETPGSSCEASQEISSGTSSLDSSPIIDAFSSSGDIPRSPSPELVELRAVNGRAPLNETNTVFPPVFPSGAMRTDHEDGSNTTIQFKRNAEDEIEGSALRSEEPASANGKRARLIDEEPEDTTELQSISNYRTNYRPVRESLDIHGLSPLVRVNAALIAKLYFPGSNSVNPILEVLRKMYNDEL